ncbi:hypothetical protein [Pseudoduganella umbonata]|uniref:Uncharacterized protein n=1 Tax=Pseudoduganella umbonata TaxID=864828 RepID=A0A4P8HV12_9BURK|nr:hypothetical protein [Pseudoduganella umbonata]MBB3222074.1 hypothetical protein [Pseudoduganella umbonata]QCP12315.1 hypothetical protein FCL38_19235 [Pseudoduganella umbonata]
MNRFRTLLLAAAGAPLFAFAQSAPVVADAADAKVAVAPPVYRSAFAGLPPADVSSASPDKLWLQANRVVAGEAIEAVDKGKSGTPSATTKEGPPSSAGHAAHHGHQMPMKGQ